MKKIRGVLLLAVVVLLGVFMFTSCSAKESAGETVTLSADEFSKNLYDFIMGKTAALDNLAGHSFSDYTDAELQKMKIKLSELLDANRGVLFRFEKDGNAAVVEAKCFGDEWKAEIILKQDTKGEWHSEVTITGNGATELLYDITKKNGGYVRNMITKRYGGENKTGLLSQSDEWLTIIDPQNPPKTGKQIGEQSVKSDYYGAKEESITKYYYCSSDAKPGALALEQKGGKSLKDPEYSIKVTSIEPVGGIRAFQREKDYRGMRTYIHFMPTESQKGEMLKAILGEKSSLPDRFKFDFKVFDENDQFTLQSHYLEMDGDKIAECTLYINDSVENVEPVVADVLGSDSFYNISRLDDNKCLLNIYLDRFS